jgi:PAS domain S-box-containing protein
MQNLAPKSDNIGIFLPVPEERDEIVDCLAGDNLTIVKLADLSILQSSTLPEYDALILPVTAWPAARHLLKVARETPAEIGPGPTLIFCSPPGSDLSMVDPDEIGENVSFIRYPLELRLFPLQLKAILRRREIVHDLRYRLKEREDVLRSISEVFFSVDHEYRYTFFNEKAQLVGGKAERELLGQDMWEAFPQLKNTEFHRQMEQVARDRKILVSEYLGPITGGWFEMRIYPSAAGLSALFVDISARKKAEESLKQAQEQLRQANANLECAVAERTTQLQRANEQLEELLYSIAHDLRSPLRSMQGYAQAFVEDFAPSLDSGATEYARRMTASAVFMDRMLKDLLELSRVAKEEIRLESVDVAQACACALMQHEQKISASAARIDLSSVSGTVRANRTLLVQILSNLLGNALKFSRPQTAPEIRVWTAPAAGPNLEIFVQDNGIGIDERYHDKVFRVFERLNGATYDGTGIGLALARKAAERMKGSLTFNSRVGEGATFRLELALASPEHE